MNSELDKRRHVHRSTARVSLFVGLVLAFVLLVVVPASASYEQVSTFGGTIEKPVPPGNFPEKAQLGGTGGMAVNVSGAGGVPAGTVYVAALDPNHPEGFVRIIRFDPDGTFRMQWTTPAERCGTPESLPACPPHATGARGAVDVEVDQTTGNVYAFNAEKSQVGAKLVQVYNATGTELITEFGEYTNGETTAASPGKLHGGFGLPGGIAVDASGNVYVFDINNSSDSFRYRLMKFRPQTPGDYSKYVYAGESEDVDPGTIKPGNEAKVPSKPVMDEAGDIYVAGENYIKKLDPSQPTAAPLCTYLVADAGLRGMNVNSATGEVFFYDYKDRKFHQLSSCSGGTFAEVATLNPTPKRGYVEALAVNPALKWEPSRAPGVLYGATSEAIGEVSGGEPGQSALGYIFAQAELHEPVVESESVSAVGFTSATLKALINPKGSATSYVFEYLTDAAYQANEPTDRFAGSSKAPIGGGKLGNGQSPVLASADLSGLIPGTLYHFRVVASSSEGSGTGEARTFQTFPLEGPGLADHRAYELVSPPQKDGGEVFPANPNSASCHGLCKPGGGSNRFPIQSSPDGGAVVYEGSAFSFGGASAVRENEYLSKRTASGWQTVPLSPSQQGSGEGFGSKAFNAELTEGLIYQGLPTLAPSAPSGYFNLYRQPSNAPSILSPLLLEAPPNRPPGPSLKLTYAGASADLSRIFFEANDALTAATAFAPAAVDGGETKKNLYEWVGGQLRLVNVLPGNAEAPAGAVFGGGKPGAALAVFAHAISDDGSHVFWTSEAGQVYARVGGSETIEIEHSGKFRAASADGSKVLLSDGCLYDLEAAACEDLTEDESEVSKGGFQGIIGQSEDLSHIYFVDTAVLTGENENDHGAKAQAGQNNLYAWQEGITTFVATLLPADSGEIFGDWAPSSVQRTAEASPNGRWVAFQSQAPLTGYDNTGPCKVISGTEQVVDGPCTEVFLYDSAEGELICASCRGSNERPLGGSTLTLMLFPEGSMPQPRYLLDSGRLYFDSRDSLTPLDTNDGVEDVYQFEPQGMGTCETQSGCVSLISAGRQGIDSNFLTADVTGNNVFFTTRDQLVAADTDELVDLYDARVGGGLPNPPTVSECQGEGCQQVPPVPPELTPTSPSVTDPGNIKPSKSCKKGQIKKKGRCIKKPKHKKQGGAAKHKRGGSR